MLDSLKLRTRITLLVLAGMIGLVLTIALGAVAVKRDLIPTRA